MIEALSGHEILRIWEIGLGQHAIDRALTILAVAFPEIPRDTLAALTIGQRDSCLLAIRERTFGSQLATLATCPRCREQVEAMLDIATMQIVPDTKPTNQLQQMILDGYEIHFRLPNSLDLAAIAHLRDGNAASQMLIQRCIQSAYCDGLSVSAEALPESVRVALAAHMAECDPLAEVQLALTCPGCNSSWQIVFDIVTFLWREVCVQAKRLLREVHILAQAYGWHEADILSMSAARRQLYIEMVT
jgi:T4 bacteriophage base plate protein